MFSAIHLLRFAIVAAFSFTSVHAAESNKPATPAPVVATTTVPKAAPPDASEIINLRKQADDSARDKAIAEAKLEVISAGNSRMEVWIGIFGILMTVLVIGFGLATYRIAAAEAKKAATDAVKDEMGEIKKLRAVAEGDAAKIAVTHDEMVKLSQGAQAAINKPPRDAAESKLPRAEAEELTTAATVVSEKPRSERTAQDFRILMFEAKQAGKWRDYFDLAEGMAYLHGKNREDLTYALFGKALAADMLGDPVLAARLYKDYLTRCPDDIAINQAGALSNWGALLSKQAKTKSGTEADELWALAIEKYAAALAIKPNMHLALSNWGNALQHQAKTNGDLEADALFAQAEEKYATALAIKPDYYEALNNWGSALLLQASRRKGDARAALLTQAEEKLLKAESLAPGYGAYNLACLSGLRSYADKAAEWLIMAKAKDNEFPGCADIAAESDFDAVRDAAVFKAALAEIGC